MALGTQDPLGARQNDRGLEVEWVGLMSRNLKNLQTQRQFSSRRYFQFSEVGWEVKRLT